MTSRHVGQGRLLPEVSTSSSSSTSPSLKDRLQGDHRATASSASGSSNVNSNSTPLLERVQGVATAAAAAASGRRDENNTARPSLRKHIVWPQSDSAAHSSTSLPPQDSSNNSSYGDLSSRIAGTAGSKVIPRSTGNRAESLPMQTPVQSGTHRFDERRLEIETTSSGSAAVANGGGIGATSLRGLDPPLSSRQDSSSGGGTGNRGRIRVSKEGDVWRSPPHTAGIVNGGAAGRLAPPGQQSTRTTQPAARSQVPAAAATAVPLSASNNNATTSRQIPGPSSARQDSDRSASSVRLPIPSGVNAESGYSPLPPFARAGMGSEEPSSDRIPRSKPHHPPPAFARQYHNQRDSFGRGPSVPPSVSSSSAAEEAHLLRDSYRPIQRGEFGPVPPPPRSWDNDRDIRSAPSYASFASQRRPPPYREQDSRPRYHNQVWRAGTSASEHRGNFPEHHQSAVTSSSSSGRTAPATDSRTVRPTLSQATRLPDRPATVGVETTRSYTDDSRGANREDSRRTSARTMLKREPETTERLTPPPRDSAQHSRTTVQAQAPPPPPPRPQAAVASAPTPSRQGSQHSEARRNVKHEPTTPPKSPSQVPPLRAERTDTPQRPPVPLFAPPTHSPEERKPFSFAPVRTVSPTLRQPVPPVMAMPDSRSSQNRADTVGSAREHARPRHVAPPLPRANEAALPHRPTLQPRSQTMKREISSPPPMDRPSTSTGNVQTADRVAAAPTSAPATTVLSNRAKTTAPNRQEARPTGAVPIYAPEDSDMEIDELSQDSQEGRLQGDSHSLPEPPAAPGKATSKPVKPKNIDVKGKGRARSVSPGAMSGVETHGNLPRSGASSTVISLLSDDDEPRAEARRGPPPAKASLNVQSTGQSKPASSTSALPPVSHSLGGPSSALQASPLPSPALAQRPEGEELSWTFDLPRNLRDHSGQVLDSKRLEYRAFIEECYEELELRYQGPLQRCEEILRSDRVRLIYTQLKLFPHELAIPLPNNCLRSSDNNVEEREKNRRSFETKEIVRLAKEGRELETTRLSASYLIIVLKANRAADSGHPIAAPKHNDRAANRIASDQPRAKVDERHQELRQPVPEKKLKRPFDDGLVDDAVSIASTSSSKSLTRKEKKAEKKAKLAEKQKREGGATTAQPIAVQTKSTRAQTNKSSLPTAEPQKAAQQNESASYVLQLGKPRLQSVSHTMYGSLSNKVKDTREKPRVFFHSPALKGYAAVSMRGHVHTWRPSREATSLVLEDKSGDAALTVQAALWSEEHQLGILGYVSGNAGSVAPLHVFSLQSSKKSSWGERKASPLVPSEDSAGVSALAWNPSSDRGIHFVGTGQSDRELRIWSVTPQQDALGGAVLKNVLKTKTPHSTGIRSILWHKEHDKIFTAGADRRVCIYDNRALRVINEWKENLPINRIYRRDANCLLLCLAGNRDQFRCVDLRLKGSQAALLFSQPTVKGDTLGQYSHGHVYEDLFAYPVDEELYIWDLRNTGSSKVVASYSGVIQPHFEAPKRLALLEKKHFTMLNF